MSSTAMYIKIDASRFNAKMKAAGQAVPAMNKEIVKRVTLEAVTQLKREAPVGKSVPGDQYQSYRKGGQLRSSITPEFSADGMKGKAGPTVEHAKFVVKGTRPHDIYPREKKALYWVGARHPVPHVFHPGTRPDNFVRRAKEKTEDKVPGIVQSEKARALIMVR